MIYSDQLEKCFFLLISTFAITLFSLKFQNKNSPTHIYVITPTYSRLVQKAELTCLCHTLMHVPDLTWIIIEDSDHTTPLVERFISEYCHTVNIVHLNAVTPSQFKMKTGESNRFRRPRGVWQRNAALKWLLRNLSAEGGSETRNVVYFADDDNTYSLHLFDEIRSTETVKVWPVAFAGGVFVEKPILEVVELTGDCRIVGWDVEFARGTRKFATDMAGFSINLKLILEHVDDDVFFNENSSIGFQENDFISKFIDDIVKLEGLTNCENKVLVWHTQTKNVPLHFEVNRSVSSNKNIEI